MSQQSQNNKPQKLNLDKSKKYLGADEMFYALNHNVLNPDALGKSTPHPANQPLCEIEQPAGENYTTGAHYAQAENEAYSWHLNSKEANYIMRAKGDGKCQIIYDNDRHNCLQLSAEPKHSIEDWRAYLHVEKLCANRDGKYLIWTDGKYDIGYIDVEASIATNSFTTPFFEKCMDDPCDFIRLCVPKPCGCLQGEFIPLPDEEITLTNHMIDSGFKFMFQHEYYDGRKSDWSDASTLFYQDVKGCFDSAEGFPRCLKLRVPVGNAMVEKIHIAFNRGGIDEAGNNVWYRAKIVEKYERYTTAQQKWYEREFSKEILKTFSDTDCSFDFIFCNNDQCEVIDPVDIGRVFNPIPREAQGLIPINGSLGFYNYKSGTCPIDKNEIQKFSIKQDCPDVAECKTELTTIKVRAIIYNPLHHMNQFIYREKAGTTDDPNDIAKFGGINPALDGGIEEPIGYDQYFRGKTRNFKVYIEGTEYYAEMKQWHADENFHNQYLHGVVDDGQSKKVLRKWRADNRKGNFFYQEAILKVPKGTKGFLRLDSHAHEDLATSTSTFVTGVMDDIRDYYGRRKLGNWNVDVRAREIYFDTCDKKELEIMSPFVVQDNAGDGGALVGIVVGSLFGLVGAIAGALTNPKPSSAYHGYITDSFGRPVEGAVIAILDNITQIPQHAAITDHNGFYHFAMDKGYDGEINIAVLVEETCGNFSEIKKENILSEARSNTRADIRISKNDNVAYPNNSQAIVKVKVKDCDGRGVGGVRVALSGSKYDVTDGHGEAKFIIRNYDTRARSLRAVLMNNKGCFSLDCQGNCNPCFTSLTSTAPACFFISDYPASPIKVIDMGEIIVNQTSATSNKVGLKKGGAYPFGFVVKGRCGRISAVNELPILEIPKLQKDDDAGYCGLVYDAAGLRLPSWADCVDIVRGKNLNSYELQWLVDKAEKTADGKIKLTIQSVNDYAESYFFKTNTIYEWLKGDRVEFITKADGSTLLATQFKGILNYLTLSPAFDKESTQDPEKEQPADYFNQLLIDDDGRLDAIFDDLEGAKIEIQRAKDCVVEPVYYGICTSIPVVQVDNGDGTTHGELLYRTGKFFTFDTFLVPRKVGKFATQYYEHHSPSDFWGNRVDDTGRAYFVNKYETEKRFSKSISLSAPAQLNYFGDLIKTFNVASDIVAMRIADGKIIFALCEYDHFVAQTADEFARVGSDGILRALPADAIITDPQPDIKGAYGCQYPDIGSIFFGDGYATFIDSCKSTLVHHENYSVAVDASDGKVQSYISKRCAEIINHNKKAGSDFFAHYRFATGINKSTKAIYLTIKRLRDSGVNNQPAPYLQGNETLVYYPPTKDFLTFFSATPEMYSQLQLHEDIGCAMLQYFHGAPYLHPINVPTRTTGWNEFFGAACDRYVGISINKFPEKERIGVSIEIEDEQMWYATKVETDKPNYDSEITPKRVVKSGRKWNAPFLGNKNSRDGLFGDEKPRGYYIAVTFCRDNTDGLKYKTIDRNLQIKYDELDEILSKFTISEQSGFTENL